MRVNPFYDSWLFLIGETGSHLGVGGWRYLLIALFWGLLVASIVIAIRLWNSDPSQRNSVNLVTWVCRVVIGAMWFEGALWKLPIPSGGFKYWLEQKAQHAAFTFHRELVAGVLLPNFTAVNTVAFLAEIGMAASFILGFGVRLFSLVSMLFAAQLYFGLYTHPGEWPWEFVFIIVIGAMFYIHAGGRSLGLDALLRRDGYTSGSGVVSYAYRAAS